METEKSNIQPLNVLANCFEAINCNDKFRGYTDIVHCEQFEEMWHATTKLRPQRRLPSGIIPACGRGNPDLIFDQSPQAEYEKLDYHNRVPSTMPILADYADADPTSSLINMTNEPILSSSELSDRIYAQAISCELDNTPTNPEMIKSVVNVRNLTENTHDASQQLHDASQQLHEVIPNQYNHIDPQFADFRYPMCNMRNQQKQTYMGHRIEDASYDLKRNQIADLILKIAGHDAVYVNNINNDNSQIYFIGITMEQYHIHMDAIFNAVSKINYTKNERMYYGDPREDNKSDMLHGIYILKNENAYTLCAFNGSVTTSSIKIMHKIYPRIGTLFLNLPLIDQIVYYYREPMPYDDIKITDNQIHRANDRFTITDQLTATTSKLYAMYACAKLDMADHRYDDGDFIIQSKVISKSCELEDIIRLTMMVTRRSHLSMGTKKINFYTMAQNKQKHMNVIIHINELGHIVKNHVCDGMHTNCSLCCCQQMHEFVMRQYDGFNTSIDSLEDIIQQPKIAKLMFRDLYKEFALAAYVEENADDALATLQKQCNMYTEQSHQMVKNVIALGPTIANYRPREYHDNVYEIINGWQENTPCDAVIDQMLMRHYNKFALIYLIIMQHCELKEIVWNVIQLGWQHHILRANRILNMWDVIPNLEVSEDITKCDDATFDQMCVNIWQQLVNDTARLEQNPQFNDGVDGVVYHDNPLDDIDARMFNYANRPIVWGVN